MRIEANKARVADAVGQQKIKRIASLVILFILTFAMTGAAVLSDRDSYFRAGATQTDLVSVPDDVPDKPSEPATVEPVSVESETTEPTTEEETTRRHSSGGSSSCNHEYRAATCTSPRTCIKCGATRGEALVHDFAPATCEKPATCKLCGATKDLLKGRHQYTANDCENDSYCTICGKIGDKATGHVASTGGSCTDPVVCIFCGKEMSPAPGHKMLLGRCTVCGKEEEKPEEPTVKPAEPEEPEEPVDPVEPEEPVEEPENAEDVGQMLSVINAQRSALGITPLEWDASLAAAAQTRADEAAVKFSHYRPDGTAFSTVSSDAVAENLAKTVVGGSEAQEVAELWMDSAGHRRNIMSGKNTTTGIAYSVGSDGRYYWVQLFGRESEQPTATN